MFFRGFICGWIGMAVIVGLLIWGITPPVTDGFAEPGGYQTIEELRVC